MNISQSYLPCFPGNRPDVSRAPLTLLVTGFGPFPGAPRNPSAAILRALSGATERRLARLGVTLECHELPVVFAEAEARIASLLQAHAPDAVLHLGLAGRRKSLGVEWQARNRLAAYPDAQRQRPLARQVLKAAPEFRRARVPVAQLVTTLRACGARAEFSRDAGAYVCNQTLYLTLGATVALAGFIHVPRPRGRLPLHRVKQPRIALATMVQAIAAALVLLARHARQSRQ